MKKVLKNNKGFAMAELLAVCVVILGLFSILFSNYLPLLSEYENRLAYNNVTAEYAAHYVRKEYSSLLDEYRKNSAFLTAMFEVGGYHTIYKEDKEEPDFCLKGFISDDGCSSLTENLKNIIDHYGIEEIIITKYQLGGVSSDSSTEYFGIKDKIKNDAPDKYKEDGKLYDYINYLPNYSLKAKINSDLGSNDEKLRIIIKTKDFGYATTAIYSNSVLKDKCIIASNDSSSKGIYIKDFIYSDECLGEGGLLTIENKNYTVGKINAGGTGLSGTVTGKIVGIADGVNEKGAFTNGYNALDTGTQDDGNFNLANILFDDNVELKKIGDYAFYGTGLTAFDMINNISSNSAATLRADSNGLTIGKYAFANTNLENVGIATKIGDSKVTYGDGAFSNNEKLKTVDFSGINDSNVSFDSVGVATDEYIGKDLFSNCSSDTGSGLNLVFSDNMKKTREGMFKGSKLSSYDFSGTNLSYIGDSSFSKIIFGQSKEVKFPSTLKVVQQDAFNGNWDISKVVFGSNPDVKIQLQSKSFYNASYLTDLTLSKCVISNSVFEKTKINDLFIPDNSVLQSDAFNNGMSDYPVLKTITFGDSVKLTNDGIQPVFAGHNQLKCIKFGGDIEIKNKSFQLNKMPDKIIDLSGTFLDESLVCGDSNGTTFAQAKYWTDSSAPRTCSLSEEAIDSDGNTYKLLTIDGSDTKVYSEGDC